MYPVRAISINSGWQVLTENYPERWVDIQQVIDSLSLDVLIHSISPRPGDAAPPPSPDTYADLDRLTQLAEIFFDRKGWSSRTGVFHKKMGFVTGSHRQNVVAEVISVNFVSTAPLYRLLLIEAPRSFKEEIVDVTVIIVATDEVAEPVTVVGGKSMPLVSYVESTCREELKDISITPATGPVVMLFISPFKQELVIEELEGVKEEFLEREVRLPRYAYQAGVSLLAYFGEVLRQTHLGTTIRVATDQQDDVIVLRVELPSGQGLTIKQELDTYFSVLAGKEQPEKLLVNPYHVLGLQGRIDFANAELRLNKQLHSHLTSDISRLENMQAVFEKSIAEQQKQIQSQEKTIQALTNVVGQQVVSYERVQLSQASHTDTLFKHLLAEAAGNQLVLQAIHSLEYHLTAGIAVLDKEDREVEMAKELEIIKQGKPSLLAHLAAQLESGLFGAAAGYALEWIRKHPVA